MAFDADEIARIKPAIPDDHRPPHDAGGVLSSHFHSVDSRSESTALQGSLSNLDRFNFGQAFLDNSDATAPSFQLTGGQVAAREAREQQREAREAQEEHSFVNRVLSALDARLGALDAQLAEIDDRLEAIRLRRVEIGDTLEAMDEIERLRKSGQLDPTNAEHAALLRQAGMTAEQAMGDDFPALLAMRRSTLGQEDAALEADWNANMKLRGEVAAERDAVFEAKQDIELADTDEARILAERRAQTLLGKQQLGAAAFDSDSGQARKLAATAVGTSEADTLRSQSTALNREAVTKEAKAVVADDGTDFELDGGKNGNRPPGPPQLR